MQAFCGRNKIADTKLDEVWPQQAPPPMPVQPGSGWGSPNQIAPVQQDWSQPSMQTPALAPPTNPWDDSQPQQGQQAPPNQMTYSTANPWGNAQGPPTDNKPSGFGSSPGSNVNVDINFRISELRRLGP